MVLCMCTKNTNKTTNCRSVYYIQGIYAQLTRSKWQFLPCYFIHPPPIDSLIRAWNTQNVRVYDLRYCGFVTFATSLPRVSDALPLHLLVLVPACRTVGNCSVKRYNCFQFSGNGIPPPKPILRELPSCLTSPVITIYKRFVTWYRVIIIVVCAGNIGNIGLCTYMSFQNYINILRGTYYYDIIKIGHSVKKKKTVYLIQLA